jgi:hypothetical protein
LGPRRVLNSLWSLAKIAFRIKNVLFGDTQKMGVKIKINKIALAQLRGRLNIEDGSKTENKLVIIIFI